MRWSSTCSPLLLDLETAFNNLSMWKNEFHEFDITPSMEGLKIPFLFSSLFSILIISNAVDTITKTQSLTGNNTIVSSGGSFEMGFFRPGNSRNQYLGIWYKKISVKTVVWVANREIPLINSSGVLTIIDPGILALVKGTGTVIWSVNVTGSTQNRIAHLMDSGNLVVKDVNDTSEKFLWQSFDYPCDTQLPGMKLGKNFETGLERHLSSWKSSDDPARGEFKFQCDPRGHPQKILSNGSVDVFRTGPWNDFGFGGTPNVFYTYGLVYTMEEVYYHYELQSDVISRFDVSYDGHLRRWIWVDLTQKWDIYLTAPTDNCDNYKLCGPNGSCNIGSSPACGCLSKFVPQNQAEWGNGDYSSGCVRRTPLDCHKGDGFLKYSRYKMPDTRNSWFDRNMTLRECEMECLKNCSCTAYTHLNIGGGHGSGCLLWFNELIDMRKLSEDGPDIYIRMASSELVTATCYGCYGGQAGHNWKAGKRIVAISVILTGTLILALGISLYIWKKKWQPKREGRIRHHLGETYYKEAKNEDIELPLFHFSTITKATENFAINNKLGEGGFGPVYKGRLEGGQEIAVKLLSKNSKQGVDEFKNEVICIAKLQHRNLVKLLGYCIQGEERLLIYEYMPNKNLDSFIFAMDEDQSQKMLLDWPTRFHIINGISRGLLYLHQDSRVRIIHRDLKGSNILLDHEMNPKISDFGLARIFGGNETVANTKRVVGTYGYMSPEYAIEGLFSVKSDIFSFGVLILEVVSGQRNRGFCHPSHDLNLLGHAWRLYKEGKATELIDVQLRNSCNLTEVLRSIHVGLLCVQQRPEDRPSMESVVWMFGREGALTHQPKHPGFFTERNLLETERREIEQCSANMVTITQLEAR
ncbi:unnamed protein product [Camellia sinensis]